MDVNHAKNLTLGNVSTGGGSFHQGDVYYQSTDYQALLKTRDRLLRFIKLAQGEEERTELQRELTETDQRIVDFERDTIALAEQFSAITVDSDRLRLARDHFERGAFAKARTILEAESLVTELDALLERGDRLQRQRQANQRLLRTKADEFLILALLTAQQVDADDWYAAAVDAFERSLRADRNPDNVSAYATFLQQHRDFTAARRLFVELLATLRGREGTAGREHDHAIAYTLSNLGLAHYNNGDLEAAEANLLEAAALLGEAHGSTDRHALELGCQTQQRLSQLYLTMLRFGPAEHHALAALACVDRLIAEGHGANRPRKSFTLNTLGTIYRKKYQYREAREVHEAALLIDRSLYADRPQDYTDNLIHSLTVLGVIVMEEGDLQGGHDHLREALNLLTPLHEHNPRRYSPTMYSVLKNLGIVFNRGRQPETAEKYYLQSLQLAESMARQQPKAFDQDVAGSLTSLAALYTDAGKLEQAEDYCRRALSSLHELSLRYPLLYDTMIAATTTCLGQVLARRGQIEAAEAQYAEGLRLLRLGFARSPWDFLPDLSVGLLDAARFYHLGKPDRETSLALVAEALGHLRPNTHLPYVGAQMLNAREVLSFWDVDINDFLAALPTP